MEKRRVCDLPYMARICQRYLESTPSVCKNHQNDAAIQCYMSDKEGTTVNESYAAMMASQDKDWNAVCGMESGNLSAKCRTLRLSDEKRTDGLTKGMFIAQTAQALTGSQNWLLDSLYLNKAGGNELVADRGDDKCNIFVADVLKQNQVKVPNRFIRYFSPIGANEWANPSSKFLTKDSCWSRCHYFRKGDVIAEGGHVAIAIGHNKTASTAYDASPKGVVVQSDWGFRLGQSPTCWRYICE